MYVVRLVPVHARGETSRPSALRMLTKGTYVLRGWGACEPNNALDPTIMEEWHGRQHLLGLLGIDGPAMDSIVRNNRSLRDLLVGIQGGFVIS